MNASLNLWTNLAEEIFFFQYNMHLGYEGTMSLPINLRKWLITRFIKQKEDENSAIEKERRKARRK